MSGRNDPTGRLVIDFLHAAWDRGVEFGSTTEIQATVIAYFRLRESTTTLRKVVAWERTARYEYHDLKKTVTHPTNQNKGLRRPNPSPTIRAASRDQELRQIVTRILNQLRVARSDADQVDATRVEIIRAVRLEQGLVALAPLVGLTI